MTRWELAIACDLDPIEVVRRLDAAMSNGTLTVHERPAAGDVVFRLCSPDAWRAQGQRHGRNETSWGLIWLWGG